MIDNHRFSCQGLYLKSLLASIHLAHSSDVACIMLYISSVSLIAYVLENWSKNKAVCR